MIKKTIIPPLSIIVAVDKTGGFGKDGKIPWNIPADMKHFQKITENSVCIMGRRTYEDMFDMVQSKQKSKTPIKEILKGRQSFVVTSKSDYKPEGAEAVKSIRRAVEQLEEVDRRNIFIIGGLRMFIEGLAWTNTVYMTIVKGKAYDCDKFFPIDVLKKKFKIRSGEETRKLYFMEYQRVKR